jgi:hypothetical protein
MHQRGCFAVLSLRLFLVLRPVLVALRRAVCRAFLRLRLVRLHHLRDESHSTISPTKCCCALRLVIACWPTQPMTHPRALPPSLLLHFPSSFFRRAWCLPFLCGVGCAVRSSAYDPSGLRNTCTRHDSLIRISDWCTRFDHAVYPTHQIPLRLQMSIPIFLSLPPACCASARLLPFGFPALLGGCGWRLFPSCM